MRRAFGDAAGFLVGWAILLDLLVVALLSALFVPRYAEAALGHIGQMSGRSAELIGVGVIAVLGGARLVPQLSRMDLVRPLALVDMLAQLTLAILGLAALGHIDVLTSSIDLGAAPTWTSLGYALPIALVAFTGIEIVAGLLQEAANPARPLRRITIGAIAATVLAYAVIAAAALSLLPVHARAGDAVRLRQRPLDDLGHGAAGGRRAGDRRAGLRRDCRRRRARARERERDRRARDERRRSRSARRCARCARSPAWAGCRRR